MVIIFMGLKEIFIKLNYTLSYAGIKTVLIHLMH